MEILLLSLEEKASSLRQLQFHSLIILTHDRETSQLTNRKLKNKRFSASFYKEEKALVEADTQTTKTVLMKKE